MPPKPKETAPKKPAQTIIRPNISNASLNIIPEDALEGFQERIESDISWTLVEESARHHKQKCTQKDLSKLTFSEAFRNKIRKSILHGFFEDTGLSLNEQWEVLLPMMLWDNAHFANKEGAICFNSANSLTDNMVDLIKRAVHFNDREVLKKDLKQISVLRLIDTKMTELDDGLKEFENLVTLNLCCNYIDSLKTDTIPTGLRMLEIQSNRIQNLENFSECLPNSLTYLGLANNFLNNESLSGLRKFPREIVVLDLSDNDIYNLDMALDALVSLPNLIGLTLAGNPCAVCAAYARTTLTRLPNLQWLDFREVLPTDRSIEPFEPHPDDLRSAYFYFTVFRVMSAPMPPKYEKGAVTAFYVEIELPLLDSTRRNFLMFRKNESVTEILPPPEDDEWTSARIPSVIGGSKTAVDPEASSHESDIYNNLIAKNSRIIRHYTIFESNKVQWNKVMNFQEPTLKMFCPKLTALRDTFRSIITIRVMFSLTMTGKQSKPTKSAHNLKQPSEQTVTLATIKCALRRPDWSQPSQHFHWDDTLGTEEAIHWGDGDLSILQYTLQAVKTPKGKPETDSKGKPDLGSAKQFPPDNLTCHFGFGIDTIRT